MMGALFDLMYENMAEVAPGGMACAWEKSEWLAEVIPALKNTPRQIALLYCKGALAGFCMYYVNGGVFMIEELQVQKEYRSSGVIVELWQFFRCMIPEDTVYMEAYTDEENTYSQKLLIRLGLQIVESAAEGKLHHFRGSVNGLIHFIGRPANAGTEQKET